MLLVPPYVAEGSAHRRTASFRTWLRNGTRGQARECTIESKHLDQGLFDDLRQAASAVGDTDFSDAIDQIVAARAGRFEPVRSLSAAPEMMLSWLDKDCLDGWVYMKSYGGVMQPFAVDDVVQADDAIQIRLHAPMQHTISRTAGLVGNDRSFDIGNPSPVIGLDEGQTVAELWEAAALVTETLELRQEYCEQIMHFKSIARPGNRVDARVTIQGNRRFNELPLETVHNAPLQCVVDSDDSQVKLHKIPAIPRSLQRSKPKTYSLYLPVFDITSRRIVSAPINAVEQHSYRKDALEGIVLPERQRSLLDLVLGSDGLHRTGDLIDGKTPGNLILCKGEPGIGKTLTAEAYAEHLERPLLTIDLAALANAEERSLADELRNIFECARHWNAVVLLDEADVIVARRGDDLHRNTMTADVLRVAERFERPLFLTTNRPDDIDDAVLSRCLLILDYEVPTGDASREVWRALARSYDVDIREELITIMLDRFTPIVPREIGQIIRLAGRMANRDGGEVTIEHLIDGATMRGSRIIPATQPV